MSNKNKQTDLLGFTVSDKHNIADYSFNDSQQKAFDAMKSGKNLYISGPAGTGKSYLIKCFADWCKRNHKSLMICAPTGMAAREIGGETCHTAFSLDVGPLLKSKKLGRPIKSLMEAEVILIDEISMLRIDAFDTIIRKVEHANDIRRRDVTVYMNGSDEQRQEIQDSEWKLKPIQLILVGDFFQLPPVLTKKDREVLEGPDGYGYKLKNGYAFQSDEWHKYGGGFETVRLTTIVRQKHDKAFTDALNLLRKGNPDGADYILEHASAHPVKGGIKLYGTRKDVAKENIRELSKLPGMPKTYEMIREGSFGDSELVADIDLVLKKGARVMSIINDPHGNRYVNGSLGTVEKLLKDLVVVKFDNGVTINVERNRWEVDSYKVADGKLQKTPDGFYEQFPLKLAYAITIHKSQGQTFDKVNISTKSFAPGQLYVALSRIKSVENMYIEGDIAGKNLKVDQEVLKFDRHWRQYKYIDPDHKRDGRGGNNNKGGRPSKHPSRGKSHPVRIPDIYKAQVDEYMNVLDEMDDDQRRTWKPILIPPEYFDYFEKLISEIEEKKN